MKIKVGTERLALIKQYKSMIVNFKMHLRNLYTINGEEATKEILQWKDCIMYNQEFILNKNYEHYSNEYLRKKMERFQENYYDFLDYECDLLERKILKND